MIARGFESKLRTLVLFGLVSGSLGVGCGTSDPTPEAKRIPIGFIGDDSSSHDIGQLVAVIRSINEDGGIQVAEGKRELELVFANFHGTIEGAVGAMAELKEKGVAAVVDPAWSSLILGEKSDFSDGAAAAAKDLDMVIVSGGATSPLLSTLDDDGRVFRTVASDAIQGQISANQVADLGIETASIIYRDDAWGRGLTEAFEAAFIARGGTVLHKVSYPADALSDYDFSPQLDDAFAGKPGAVLIAAFDEVLGITSHLDTGNYFDGYGAGEPKLVGTDGFFNAEQIVTNMPASVLDRLLGTVPRSNPESADYKAAIKIAKDAAPDGTVDGARFDAVALIALAIEAAGENDASKIKSVLQDVSRKDDGDVEIHVGDWKKARETLVAGGTVNYEGASGSIDFDDNGDRSVGWIGLWKVVKDGASYSVDDSTIVPYGD